MLSQTVKSLSIHWIEAHKGHAGNEKADEMARAAEFRRIMDKSIDAPAGYDKAKYTLKTSLSYADSVKWNQKPLTTYSMNVHAFSKPGFMFYTTNPSVTHLIGTRKT